MVRNVEQRAVDGVGAYLFIVTMDEDCTLNATVVLWVTHYGVRTIRDIDGVLNVEPILQGEVDAVIHVQCVSAVVIAIVMGNHNVGHAIPVNVACHNRCV